MIKPNMNTDPNTLTDPNRKYLDFPCIEHSGDTHYVDDFDPTDGTISRTVLALCQESNGTFKYHTAVSDGVAWFDTNVSSEKCLDVVKWWPLPDFDTACRQGEVKVNGKWEFK